MYQLLLTRKYLTSKVMPLLASLAVMLCTAMVLVTWSVMGGFLESLRTSGRQYAGDVTILWPAGIGHYEELLRRIRADGSVRAAAPLIETFGLVSLPDDQVVGVQVIGADPALADVIDFKAMMWWKPIDRPLRRDRTGEDPRLRTEFQPRFQQALDFAMQFQAPDPVTRRLRPAIIPGIEVIRLAHPRLTGEGRRRPEGYYEAIGLANRPIGDGRVESKAIFPPNETMTLRVLPLDLRGRAIALAEYTGPIANEFRTGLFPIDSKTVYVNLSQLQVMMKMDGGVRTRPDFDPYETGDDGFAPASGDAAAPSRVTTITIAAAPGVPPDTLKRRIEAIYRQFADEPEYRAWVPPYSTLEASRLIRTWEEANAQMIGAVQKETALVLFLLWFISLVASFCILAIFWAMISEKTKDIGILRAIGASRPGVGLVWIGYGLALGLIGSTLGLALAYVIVTNINPIHEWLGAAAGIQIWDPRVYYFTEIPNAVNPTHSATVFVSGLAMSLIGSVVPAMRAALMDPVRSLRFE